MEVKYVHIEINVRNIYIIGDESKTIVENMEMQWSNPRTNALKIFEQLGRAWLEEDVKATWHAAANK